MSLVSHAERELALIPSEPNDEMQAQEVAESIERAKKKKPPGAETLDGRATPDGLQRTKRKR